nr:MAG TPA: hypothetical protein [Caudoviricetes sp.]
MLLFTISKYLRIFAGEWHKLTQPRYDIRL